MEPIITKAKTDYSIGKTWIQAHERLIIIVLSGLLLWFAGTKVLGYVAEHDRQQATAAQKAADVQAATNKKLEDEVAQTTTQYQQLVVQLTQQNAALQQASQTRTIVLHGQQTKDQTIPIPELGNRWAQLANLPQGSMTATNDGITLTPEAARATVIQLEEVPVLQQNLVDEKTINANLNTQLAASTDLNGKLVVQVTGLKTQIVDDKKAHDEEVKTIKAEARKSKSKWFAAGVVVGYVGGIATSILFHK